jgi:hypothetical protein
MAKRLKRLSRRFLPFIIAGLTILTTVTVASFSLLHPSAVNAQQVSRGDGYVSIDLPSTGNQDDNWSCGPNSAARVLAFYGHNVDYNAVRSAVNQEFMLPPSVNVPAPTWTDPFRTRRVDIRTGTTPHVLRDVMQRWEGNKVRLERGTSFSSLLNLLSDGKPVITLLRVGSIPPETTLSGTWPELHWVAVHGFNAMDRMIYYTDTDGGRYQISYDEFQGQWDWRVGRGFASEALHRNGVQAKTMIWVDRVVGSTTASSNTTPQLSSADLCWYQHSGWQDGSASWANNNCTKVGSGWSFRTVFASSDGVVYGINANNELLWYKHNGWQNGTASWASGTGTRVGSGWSFGTVFASSDGVIYGINANKELCWYKHNGWQNGTASWASNNCTKVGSGWNFKTVFATNNGIIYAIRDNGDLLWYKHNGWQDGSTSFARGSGTKVGSGWNFKTVFASSDGVIYGIKDNGDLHWYKHNGWQDGSTSFARGSGTKVGSGWNFRSAFATSNGSIYGIVR